MVWRSGVDFFSSLLVNITSPSCKVANTLGNDTMAEIEKNFLCISIGWDGFVELC